MVVGNIFPSIHTVNLHKNWEELGLTVVILPSIRRKEKTIQYLGCERITCKFYTFNLRIINIF